MKRGVLVMTGVAAAALASVHAHGDAHQRRHTPPESETVSWPVTSALPRARVDASAPRESLERSAWALLEGYVPPGGLAVESYDPKLSNRATYRVTYETPAKRRRGVQLGAVTVKGELQPEMVTRIVRQNMGRFRLCYENGLRDNPNLQGRVTVRFVINGEGEIRNVANGGSDLPDSSVVTCVLSVFRALSFPPPEKGLVTVTYPILFSPGG